MFKTIIKRLLPASFAAFLASCSAGQTSPQSMPLVGSEWGSDVSGQYIAFKAGGAAQGNGGCNQFSGKYTQDVGGLSIGPIMSTKMTCPNLQGETEFFRVLGAVRRAEITHLKLALSGENGNHLMTLRRRDWD